MSREAHVRFWESARVRFPRATQLIAVGSTDWPGTSAKITQSPFSEMADSVTPYNYVQAPGANVLGYTLTNGSTPASIKYNSGTSFSSPIVAAEIALIQQALMEASPHSSQIEIAAASVHNLTIGLVGILTNPNPSPAGLSPNPYGDPA